MPRPRACRPTLQSLEARLVLSLSFSKLVDSLFPFLDSKDSRLPRRLRHPAQVAVAHPGAARAGHAEVQGAVAVAMANRAERRAPDTRPIDGSGTDRNVVIPVYGAFLGRSGRLHRLPPRFHRTTG